MTWRMGYQGNWMRMDNQLLLNYREIELNSNSNVVLENNE